MSGRKNKANTPEHFVNVIKKRGALLAKGKLLGVQFDTLFTDGLYYRISAQAIEKAMRLKELFRAKGYRFFLDTPTNQQFVVLENAQMAELAKSVAFSFWEKVDDDHTAVRFATSWSTSDEDMKALEAAL